MIIPKKEAQECLDRAREMHGKDPWIDLHVSPFEVIFNAFSYSPNPDVSGVFSFGDSRYEPPVVGPLVVSDDRVDRSSASHQEGTERMSLFIYRRAFSHIGPRVLGDQMALSAIDKCLLLPVLHPQSDGKAEMSFIENLYRNDARFSLGYCIPNSVKESLILDDIRRAEKDHGVKAIKLNPNITGIDLSTSKGKGRVEAILDACRTARLPFIIHGGESTVLADRSTKSYASMGNLEEIDWGIARGPVVICHAGMMGAALIDIEKEIIPRLKRILAAHSRVMVDIAALDMRALCLLLRNIDEDQIVFGSDYHYFSQWGTVVKLIRALTLSVDKTEERFLKIMALNPARCL